MDPVSILEIINGALTIIEAAAPGVQAAVKSGQISPDTQAALLARVAALHQSGAFQGPEWAQSTAPA